MAQGPRKTERMVNGSAPAHRATDRMGEVRDTVQDPPRVYDTTGPDPEPAQGPRGTAVLPRAAKPPHKASDKAVAGEVLIGSAKAPRPQDGSKVDVSRVDPRRAPTQKSARRPEAYLAQAKGRRGLSPLALGLIVVGVLAALAALLLLLLLRQQPGAP